MWKMTKADMTPEQLADYDRKIAAIVRILWSPAVTARLNASQAAKDEDSDTD
jgi:hypothetical protein